MDRTGKNRTVVPVKGKMTETGQIMIYEQIVDCLTIGQIPDPKVCHNMMIYVEMLRLFPVPTGQDPLQEIKKKRKTGFSKVDLK